MRIIDFDAAEVRNFVLDAAEGSGPRLSAFAPMVRAGDTLQNDTRIKNLRREARTMLEQRGLEKRRVAQFIEPLEQELSGPAWREHQGDGIAIFVEPERALVVKCPESLEQQTVVADSFYLLPLLPMFRESPDFTVLAISINRVRRVEVSGTSASEAALPDDMPQRMTDATGAVLRQDSLQQHSPQPGPGMFHGQGAGNDDVEPELARYCQAVADAAAAAIPRGRPVVLAGDTRICAMFRRTQGSGGLNLADEDIEGNHDRTPERELAARGRRIVLDDIQRRESDLADRFNEDVGRGRASDDPAAILTAATEGRVDTLLVELALAAAADTSAAHTHTTNDAVLATLLNGGAVRTIESAKMPTEAPVAALLRY